MAIQRKTIVKWVMVTFWVAMGAGTVVLLVAAIHKKDSKDCAGINVNIHGASNNFFVDKNDILNSIIQISGGKPAGQPVNSFNLKMIEGELVKNIWVRSAQLFFDNNEMLQVIVEEREPVARIFTTTGTTFYIDSSVTMLPLSDKFSARVPVFTGFPSDKLVLTQADSNLLKDIKTVSAAIQKDSFSMAMIDQVDITQGRTFEMLPKIGNQLIVFGDATDADEKLNKLQMFYKEVMLKAGWSYYSVVNVQYKNQVIAKRKGAEDKSADSLRTLQIMQLIAINAKKYAQDSVHAIMEDNEANNNDLSIIQQSVERDDNDNSNIYPYPSNTFEKPQPQGEAVIVPVIINPKPVKKPKPALTPVSKPVTINPVHPPVVKPKPIPAKPQATVIKTNPVIEKKPVVVKPATIPEKKPVVTNTNNTVVKPVLKTEKPKPAATNPVKPKPTQQKPAGEKPKNDY